MKKQAPRWLWLVIMLLGIATFLFSIRPWLNKYKTFPEQKPKPAINYRQAAGRDSPTGTFLQIKNPAVSGAFKIPKIFLQKQKICNRFLV